MDDNISLTLFNGGTALDSSIFRERRSGLTLRARSELGELLLLGRAVALEAKTYSNAGSMRRRNSCRLSSFA
jgi:hypothetical protein